MTNEQIAEHHKALAQLGERIEEVTAAAKRNPWSRDIAFLEKQLAKRWNALLEQLNDAGLKHDYKPRVIVEDEKPVPLTWLQQLFVETGQTPTDLIRKDDPKPSMFQDGLKDLCGY
jgi:hypothetical protein